MNKHFVMLTTLLLGSALATHNSMDQAYLSNPYDTDLQVEVWLDQAGQFPGYFAGENIQIYTKVNQDAYVYLFNVDASGRVDLILPNPYTRSAQYVQAGDTVAFPDANAPYAFEVAAPYGSNQIIALASKVPLDLEPFDGSGPSSRYRTFYAGSEENFVDKMSYVLGPVQDWDWVTSTTFYNVQR